MTRLAGNVGEDGSVESRLAKLPKHDGAKLRNVQRRRPQRYQRLAPRFLEMLAGRHRDPLRQHRERAARLLELLKRPPFAVEHRQRRWMERVASLEPPAKKLSRLGFCRGRVDRHPLRREPGAALEAPISIFLGDPLADALVADVLEQAPPYDLADLGL